MKRLHKFISNKKDWELSLILALIMLVFVNIVHFDYIAGIEFTILAMANAVWTLIEWVLLYMVIKFMRKLITEMER